MTGGFTRLTLVLNIWESSCSFFFFFKTFLHIRPLEKFGLSTYFPPFVLRPDFESLLLPLLTPVFLYVHAALLCRYMYSEKQIESSSKSKLMHASCVNELLMELM